MVPEGLRVSDIYILRIKDNIDHGIMTPLRRKE